MQNLFLNNFIAFITSYKNFYFVGTFDVGCTGECTCEHGECDPRAGKCICDNGYIGTHCEHQCSVCMVVQFSM